MFVRIENIKLIRKQLIMDLSGKYVHACTYVYVPKDPWMKRDEAKIRTTKNFIGLE